MAYIVMALYRLYGLHSCGPRQRKLGIAHPLVADTQSNLAGAFLARGNVPQALYSYGAI